MQTDDFSEEDEGSPSGRNKRVQANRLSAQRSRQRKLEKEAHLRADVEDLDLQIGDLKAKEKDLIDYKEGEPSCCCVPTLHWRLLGCSAKGHARVPGQTLQEL